MLYLDPAIEMNTTQLVRDTDYVLLQMMGRIAHKCALLPVVPKKMPQWPNFRGWPYKH